MRDARARSARTEGLGERMTVWSLLDAFVCLLWLHSEHAIARWLPWWRRYLPVIPWVAITVAIPPCQVKARLVCVIVAVVLRAWNVWTASKNKRDGNDQHKVEAARAELTDTQRRAFAREVAEAT